MHPMHPSSHANLTFRRTAAPMDNDELRDKVYAVQIENQKDLQWRIHALQALGSQGTLIKRELLQLKNADAFTMIEHLIQQQQGEDLASQYRPMQRRQDSDNDSLPLHRKITRSSFLAAKVRQASGPFAESRQTGATTQKEKGDERLLLSRAPLTGCNVQVLCRSLR